MLVMVNVPKTVAPSRTSMLASVPILAAASMVKVRLSLVMLFGGGAVIVTNGTLLTGVTVTKLELALVPTLLVAVRTQLYMASATIPVRVTLTGAAAGGAGTVTVAVRVTCPKALQVPL